MTTTVSLELAAFGTQPNGASAGLIAGPEGRSLEVAEAEALRLIFDAARPHLETRQHPAWAFKPLATGDWLLARLDVLGWGGVGWSAILWGGFVRAEALAAINWRVGALMAAGLPPPGRPSGDRRLPPRTVVVEPDDRQAGLPPALVRASDAVVTPLLHRASLLLVPPASIVAGLSTDRALAILWERLPPAHRRRSFASWHAMGDEFDIVAVTGDAMTGAPADPPRLSSTAQERQLVHLRLDAGPLPEAEELRRIVDGLPFPARDIAPEAVDNIAADLLASGPEPAWHRLAAMIGPIREQPAWLDALLVMLVRVFDRHLVENPRMALASLSSLIDAHSWLATRANLGNALAQRVLDRDALPLLQSNLQKWLAPAMLADEGAMLIASKGLPKLIHLHDQWNWWWQALAKAGVTLSSRKLLAAAACALAGRNDRRAALKALAATGPSWALALRRAGGAHHAAALQDARAFLPHPDGNRRVRLGGIAALINMRRAVSIKGVEP